jgi:hypothetical protein
MNKVAEVVCEVYAAGAKLVILDGGIGVDGEIPGELKEKVRVRRGGLLEALTGDPLEGLGWEVRTALYRRALRWLDERTSQGVKEGVTKSLCCPEVVDQLNEVWCKGTFDEFRVALRAYIGAGLRPTKGAA